MWPETIAISSAAAAGVLAWGVRGRSATLLAPGVWQGPSNRRAIALTFDDGPSESTPQLLDLLEQYAAKATFFQVGSHARRLPEVVRRVIEGGHEVGNHTESHSALYLRSPAFIEREIARAQETLQKICGVPPSLFRPTYGARWFGLRGALRRHGLTNVMWSTIAGDWRLSGEACAARLRRGTRAGAIFCLHDGREMIQQPRIDSTLDALRRMLPVWKSEGYEFLTVSGLVGS
jgi:peptidoglycan/xylan/chitin deacetylase (PgdA/CDA1 family)